jgi:hypothetical protein
MVDSVDSLNQKYEIENTLGTGVSVVKKAVNKTTKKNMLLNIYRKKSKAKIFPEPLWTMKSIS